MPKNTNGEMSLKIYKDQIIELIVKLWLTEDHNFALEKDSDSVYKKIKTCNIVYFWKKKNKLK